MAPLKVLMDINLNGENMTLIEALKSGKSFRLKGDVDYMHTNMLLSFSYSDVLSEDWEIKEPSITITKSEFLHKLADSMKEGFYASGYMCNYPLINKVQDLLINKLFGE